MTSIASSSSASVNWPTVAGDAADRPWPLQPAEAEIAVNSMAEWLGIALPAVPPLLHFAERLDVVGWRCA